MKTKITTFLIFVTIIVTNTKGQNNMDNQLCNYFIGAWEFANAAYIKNNIPMIPVSADYSTLLFDKIETVGDKIKITVGKKRIVIDAGSKKYTVNGKTHTFENAPEKTANGIVYVSGEFIPKILNRRLEVWSRFAYTYIWISEGQDNYSDFFGYGYNLRTLFIKKNEYFNINLSFRKEKEKDLVWKFTINPQDGIVFYENDDIPTIYIEKGIHSWGYRINPDTGEEMFFEKDEYIERINQNHCFKAKKKGQYTLLFTLYNNKDIEETKTIEIVVVN